MRIVDTLKAAQNSLLRNWSRSLLTMLGVVIGVGSVVLMTAVGASMEHLILSQISSIGASSMVIFPGQQEGGGQGALQAGYDSLTQGDVDAIQKLTTVKTVAPSIFVSADKATYGREETEPRVVGTVPEYFLNREVTVAKGRLLEQQDNEAARNVAVLGSEIADELFGREEPIGKRIVIGDRPYTVIGTLESIGTQFFQNADEFVFIPLSFARSVSGQKYFNVITMQSTGNFAIALDDVTALLRARHGIFNPTNDSTKDDFIVRSSEQANEILGSVSLGLTLFITTIAGISLIVGGIGIMNIMLVSVTERTREIGLRKAIGAKRIDILLQFLIEAVFLTLIAGIVGVILGIGFAALIAAIAHKFLTTYVFAISIPSVFIALIMAFATGLGFGLYPARKASLLSPIEALRYE